MPLFRLQIVDEHDHVVQRFNGGGPLEIDLIERCTSAIVDKGVGVLRTTAHVEQDVRNGITETIRDLKEETRRLV